MEKWKEVQEKERGWAGGEKGRSTSRKGKKGKNRGIGRREKNEKEEGNTENTGRTVRMEMRGGIGRGVGKKGREDNK